MTILLFGRSRKRDGGNDVPNIMYVVTVLYTDGRSMDGHTNVLPLSSVGKIDDPVNMERNDTAAATALWSF